MWALCEVADRMVECFVAPGATWSGSGRDQLGEDGARDWS